MNSWQDIRQELIRRINDRQWQPGEFIPAETELAEEFGCARATVNRAMRELAEAGLVERRRKAGTRVMLNPVRKATLDIPVTRLEIEQRGSTHRHNLLSRTIRRPPAKIAENLGLAESGALLNLRAIHFADNKPFLYEDRWVNPAGIPAILDVDFSTISANEWLVHNAPFTHGDISFTAENATTVEAVVLDARQGEALFVIDRTTWNQKQPITAVRLVYAPGFSLSSVI